MTNKQAIEKKIKEQTSVIGFEPKLGTYSDKLDKLNQVNLKKVLEAIELLDSTDETIFINRKPHVVEIVWIEDEVDLNVLSKDEHLERYGEPFED